MQKSKALVVFSILEILTGLNSFHFYLHGYSHGKAMAPVGWAWVSFGIRHTLSRFSYPVDLLV